MVRSSLIASAAILLFGAIPVRAAERLPFAVAYSECAEQSIGEELFRQALALETNLPEYARASDPLRQVRWLEVRIDCTLQAKVRVSSERGSAYGKVRLDDVAAADRPRTLALAVAELVRARFPEPISSPQEPPQPGVGRFSDAEPTSEAAVPPVSPSAESSAAPSEAPSEGRLSETAKAAPAPQTAAEPPRDIGPPGPPEGASAAAQQASERNLDVLLSGALRWFPEHAGLLWGGSGGLRLERWRFTAEGLLGSAASPVGDVTTGIASMRAAFVPWDVTRARWQIAAFVSLGGGVTWAVAKPDEPVPARDVLEPYFDAQLHGEASYQLTPGFALRAEVGAGRAVGLVARAAGEPLTATGGWLTGLEVGVIF